MFRDVEMKMDQDGKGAWKVDSVRISRLGEQTYSVSTDPPVARDFGKLPLGSPFSCTTVSTGGEVVALLTFSSAFVTPWHDSKHDPFDSCRAVVLTMDVDGLGPEELVVHLSCVKHCQPKPSLVALAVQAVVTVALAIVHFFKHLFKVPKRGALARDVEAELAAAGPHGTGKELHR